MPGVRSVAFGAWVRAASLHEPRERMGVSHLLEHMVFKGTSQRSAHQIALSLEALGGSLDAYTSREHTVYQARVLDEHLEHAADVIGDIVFRPLLRESDLALERKVVLEEIGMVEDTPDDLVFELHNEQLWGAHPYGYSILGTRETVGSLGVDDLRALHTRAYHPGQLIVAASGNVRHDDLMAVLERTGWLAIPGGEGGRLRAPTPQTQPPSEHHVKRDGAQTHIVMGTRAVEHQHPHRFPLLLVSMLLGGGMSSRLFQRVREELGSPTPCSRISRSTPTAEARRVRRDRTRFASDALAAIRKRLERVSRMGSRDEIAMGKQQLKGPVTLSLESVSARMYRAASVELYGEPFRSLDEVLALIDAISHGDRCRRARILCAASG
jgi:predicted Zn-dependent peptidase